MAHPCRQTASKSLHLHQKLQGAVRLLSKQSFLSLQDILTFPALLYRVNATRAARSLASP
jgi:hypothetical protein